MFVHYKPHHAHNFYTYSSTTTTHIGNNASTYSHYHDIYTTTATHIQPLPHHIKIQPQPPPLPHSASCITCLFICVHISKCAGAPRKNTTSASCSGKTILGTSIGAGCSNKCSLHKGTTFNLLQILPLCYLHLVTT